MDPRVGEDPSPLGLCVGLGLEAALDELSGAS